MPNAKLIYSHANEIKPTEFYLHNRETGERTLLNNTDGGSIHDDLVKVYDEFERLCQTGEIKNPDNYSFFVKKFYPAGTPDEKIACYYAKGKNDHYGSDCDYNKNTGEYWAYIGMYQAHLAEDDEDYSKYFHPKYTYRGRGVFSDYAMLSVLSLNTHMHEEIADKYQDEYCLMEDFADAMVIVVAKHGRYHKTIEFETEEGSK